MNDPKKIENHKKAGIRCFQNYFHTFHLGHPFLNNACGVNTEQLLQQDETMEM